MRFLITAGPTREYIDDVRFISNASSGRMGYAIASAAAAAGHTVDLVSGPVVLAAPVNVALTRVTTTREMFRAAARLFPRCDCLIGAAAPADYRPASRLKGKSKKHGRPRTLRLQPTVDILATLGAGKQSRLVIAFALEIQRPVSNALAKLKKKYADAVVLNSPVAMGAERSAVKVFLRDGSRIEVGPARKETIARRLVTLAERLHAQCHPES